MLCPYFNRQTFAQRFKYAFSSLLIYSIHGNFVVFFGLDSILAQIFLYHVPIGNYLDGANQCSSLAKYNIKCEYEVYF